MCAAWRLTLPTVPMPRRPPSSSVRANCIFHCSSRGGCGQHFISLKAFEAHLVRLSQGSNRFGVQEHVNYHMEPEHVGLVPRIVGGKCSLTEPEQTDVVVWGEPQ